MVPLLRLQMYKAFRRIRDVVLGVVLLYFSYTYVRLANTYSNPQIRHAGYWERGSISTTYLSRLPHEFIHIAASFSRTIGNYHLKRATVQLPAVLTSQIWP
jgi:hypothetical protein